MNTIITFSTVLIFLFIVYKRKFSGFSKKLEKKEASPAPSCSGASADPVLCPGNGKGVMRIEVFAFDYAESGPAVSFSDLIGAKLSLLFSQIEEKGILHKFTAVTSGTALVVFVIYEMF